jgi:hypothetical protein
MHINNSIFMPVRNRLLDPQRPDLTFFVWFAEFSQALRLES